MRTRRPGARAFAAFAAAAAAAATASALLAVTAATQQPDAARVGFRAGEIVLPTGEHVRPDGRVLVIPGRPHAVAAAPGWDRIAVKTSHGITLVDPRRMSVVQTLPYPRTLVRAPPNLGGAAPLGVAWTPDGRHLWTTDGFTGVYEATRAHGTLRWSRALAMPGPSGRARNPKTHALDPAAPADLAVSADGTRVFVALTRTDRIAVIDAQRGAVIARIPVAGIPYALAAAHDRLFVTTLARETTRTDANAADSGGTSVRIDAAGAGIEGDVVALALPSYRQVYRTRVGYLPTALAALDDELFVANAGSDTVSVLDARHGAVLRTLALATSRERLGRAPGALAADPAKHALYVAEGGANEVAVLTRTGTRVRRVRAAWYPSAVAVRPDGTLFVASLKGVGSRGRAFGFASTIGPEPAGGYNVYDYAGTLQRVDPAAPSAVADATPPRAPPPALPRIEHVVLVIKENHTYDDFFGDMPEGDGDARLCPFGANVTPNQHALARAFGLFDNFYADGTLSADGHQWLDEGAADDYVERQLAAFARSYPSDGTDPLAVPKSGFLWTELLRRRRAVRIYGEDVRSGVRLGAENPNWTRAFARYRRGLPLRFTQDVANPRVRPLVAPHYPGFDLRIPDQYRASVFLADLRANERRGTLAALTVVQLGDDHTAGRDPGYPTPRAAVADNDLALGRIVAGLSRSAFWRTTAAFVVEDDAQDGFDHVDGHRSVLLVVSPYTRRAATYHALADHAGVLKTIALLLGIPPPTRFVARARAVPVTWSNDADLTPYDALPNRIPLDEMNPPAAALHGAAKTMAERSSRQDYSAPDRAEPGVLSAAARPRE